MANAIAKIIILTALIALISLAIAYPLQIAINYVVGPSALGFLFGGYITYWKTFVLMYVIGILFKSNTATK